MNRSSSSAQRGRSMGQQKNRMGSSSQRMGGSMSSTNRMGSSSMMGGSGSSSMMGGMKKMGSGSMMGGSMSSRNRSSMMGGSGSGSMMGRSSSPQNRSSFNMMGGKKQMGSSSMTGGSMSSSNRMGSGSMMGGSGSSSMLGGKKKMGSSSMMGGSMSSMNRMGSSSMMGGFGSSQNRSSLGMERKGRPKMSSFDMGSSRMSRMGAENVGTKMSPMYHNQNSLRAVSGTQSMHKDPKRSQSFGGFDNATGPALRAHSNQPKKYVAQTAHGRRNVPPAAYEVGREMAANPQDFQEFHNRQKMLAPAKGGRYIEARVDTGGQCQGGGQRRVVARVDANGKVREKYYTACHYGDGTDAKKHKAKNNKKNGTIFEQF